MGGIELLRKSRMVDFWAGGICHDIRQQSARGHGGEW
jgi:hypothetical protein